MNKQLEDFARKALKEGLAQCTEVQRDLFKRMYTGGLAMNQGIDINMVVDEMESGKLDVAMQQVQNSIENKEN